MSVGIYGSEFWIGQPKPGWTIAPLGSRYYVELGKMLNEERSSVGEQRPYLGNANVRWGSFDLHGVKTMHFNDAEWARYGVEPGDVLVCEGGEIGRAAMWQQQDLRIHFQKALHRLRPVDPRSDDPRFIVYALEAAAKNGVFHAASSKATIDHLTGEKLKEHRFPFPPRAVQRRIADYLDTETARLDQLIERNQRAGSLAWERFRVLRRDRLADGRLLGDPELDNALESLGWSVQPLWMNSRNHDGKRIPLNAEERGQRPGPYPYWGANSVQGYIDDWLFEGAHVLIGEDGAPYFDEARDVAWVAEGRFWVNNHAHVLEPIGIEAAWLAECLNAVDYSQFVVGSTRDKLTQAALNSIPIPVPQSETRRQVLGELAEYRSHAQSLEQAVAREVDLLHERRQALVTAAVTGELEV